MITPNDANQDSLNSRFVVYTCLFGHYEHLNEQPISIYSDWDFICFTDRDDLTSDTWNIVKIKNHGMEPARESRRPKLLPHLYLKEYDRSIFIDNTVILKMTPEDIVKECPSDVGFVCFRHKNRDCTYDEGEQVISMQIDDEVRVREQMDYYRSKGLKDHSGLIAGTFILRDHNDHSISAFSEDWFAHVLRFSKRDQLSFIFVAKMHNLSYTALDLNLRNNNFFSWPNHNQRLPYGFNADIYTWLNADINGINTDPAKHYIEIGKKENRRIRYHGHLEIETLANKYKSDKGGLYYNRHYYSRVYEHYFKALKNAQMTLLEIGLLRHDVQAKNPNGPFSDAPSLRMWRDYFSAADIHGFDIADFHSIEEPRIKFTRGDQSNRADLERAVENLRHPIQVIIDDGLHASPHQQISLGYLFQHLAPGGLYIIEDLHFQPKNHEPIDAKKTVNVLKRMQSKRLFNSQYLTDEENNYLENNIDSVRFYDSMDYNSRDIGADAIAVLRKK